ncbi:MFS transporter [Amycolatopsis sp. NPDC049868]|uniref:MFS transporter n=1 Tax=Amycolatopsis sp. NPDC049868 TaxID=3363934 RepID=UPI003789B3E6
MAERTTRTPWGLLPVLSGNMILDAIEVSIVLLALPAIASDLDSPLWMTQWLMSGFALGFAAMLPAGPMLAARCGRRRTYLGALVVFVLASLLGGLSGSIAVLIAARVVKGCCAALTAPAGLVVIGTVFPEGPRRRRAVAIYSMFGAAGFTAGLLLSVLLLAAGWRWVFLFPAPVALVLLVAAWRTLPGDDDGPVAVRIPFSLLRNGSLVRSAIGAATLNGAYVSLLVLISWRLSGVRDWPAWQIALGLLPACVPLLVLVPFSGALVARFGTARLVAAGAVVTLAGELLYLARPSPEAYLTGLLPVFLLVEAGFVLSFAALNMQAVSAVAAELRPVSVPLYQTGVQLGGVLLLPLVTWQADGSPLIVAAGLIGAVAAFGGTRAGRRKVLS